MIDRAEPGETFAEREFTAFGLSHWVVLIVFAVGAVVLVALGREYRDALAARRVERAFAVAMLALLLVIQGHTIAAARSLPEAAPLHISDLVSLAAVYALWSRRHWPFALTYYWGLLLSTQALVSPVLQGPDFPGRDFLVFWGMHLLVIWTAVYLTWGIGLRPNWHDYRTTIAVTTCWAVIALVFNSITGTNYGFLNRKPEIASVLDVLGPWPWYLVPEIALVLGAWALMTWPWQRRGAQSNARA